MTNVSCDLKIGYFVTIDGLSLLFNLYSGVLSAKVRAVTASQYSRYPDVLEGGTPEFEAIVLSTGSGRPEYYTIVPTTGSGRPEYYAIVLTTGPGHPENITRYC
jgi:hypothetical protein